MPFKLPQPVSAYTAVFVGNAINFAGKWMNHGWRLDVLCFASGMTILGIAGLVQHMIRVRRNRTEA